METLGQYLRREREHRGLSLEDVSQATKIKLSLLARLEEDQYSQLPDGTFVRGFLKSYGKYARLNVDEILSRYSRELPESRGGEDPYKMFRQFDAKTRRVFVFFFLTVAATLAVFFATR